MDSWRLFWKSVTHFEWTDGVHSGRVSLILNCLMAFILDEYHSFCWSHGVHSGNVTRFEATCGVHSRRASLISNGLMAFIQEGRHSF